MSELSEALGFLPVFSTVDVFCSLRGFGLHRLPHDRETVLLKQWACQGIEKKRKAKKKKN
jgi:hypothetical protein